MNQSVVSKESERKRSPKHEIPRQSNLQPADAGAAAKASVPTKMNFKSKNLCCIVPAKLSVVWWSKIIFDQLKNKEENGATSSSSSSYHQGLHKASFDIMHKMYIVAIYTLPLCPSRRASKALKMQASRRRQCLMTPNACAKLRLFRLCFVGMVSCIMA